MTLAHNLTAIRAGIAAACKDSHRLAADVTLVAVSKVQPDDRIDEALTLGLRHFGENRVQEAKSRWEPRRARYPDLCLHLIGSLQSNKAREAVALFDVIETLDRSSLARELAAEMTRQNRHLPCLIQVNTGAEDQKGGVLPGDLPGLLAESKSLGLTVTGLMCLPPVADPPELHFALLRKLARRHGLSELSMGMSHDYRDAIALGATSVRIGTALFGDRIS